MLERLCYLTSMKKSRSPIELNKLAAFIVDRATNEEVHPIEISTKNQAAVELGRLGGLKGGKARAEKLTAKRRKEIALLAARVRWKTRTEKNSEKKD